MAVSDACLSWAGLGELAEASVLIDAEMDVKEACARTVLGEAGHRGEREPRGDTERTDGEVGRRRFS